MISNNSIELSTRGLSATSSRFLITPIYYNQMNLLDIKFQVYLGSFPNLPDFGNFSHMESHIK
jgi:hypothetical protein